jgi:L-threonylcarbamoyladenylate synthase
MLRLRINPLSPDEAALREAAHVIKNGGIAVYPTETVYGLAAAYDTASALERLFAAKGRQETKPVLLLIESSRQLAGLAGKIQPQALQLAEKWWPGPLTMLFKARPCLSPYLTGDEGKVACRVSSSAVAQRLVELVGCPITSTSANLAGGASATRIADIPRELLERVDVVIDAGSTPGGLPSTLLDVSILPFIIVREGAIPSEKIF